MHLDTTVCYTEILAQQQQQTRDIPIETLLKTHSDPVETPLAYSVEVRIMIKTKMKSARAA
jgi:hypothetical protein